MKYYECPHCGCALDFGERCDCLDKAEEMRKEMEEGTVGHERYKILKVGK